MIRVEDFFDYIQYPKVVAESLQRFPDLVGFYDSKSQTKHLEDSLGFFFNFFEAQIKDCHIFSNLTEFNGHLDDWGESDHSVAKKMAELKWLTHDRAKPIFIHSINPNIVDLKDACRFIFKGFTYGDFFLFWPEEGLAAYPRNQGFGLIAKKTTPGINRANAFLKTVKQSSFMDVEINCL